jgi:phosphoglycerol transferase MdoB-like AlkP superfamily enzyme
MRLLDIVFFHVYQYFKSQPAGYISAYGLVSTSLSSLFLALLGTLSIDSKELVIIAIVPVLVTTFILCYVRFLHKAKYADIENTIEYSKWDTKKVKIFVWIFVATGFASMITCKYFFLDS